MAAARGRAACARATRSRWRGWRQGTPKFAGISSDTNFFNDCKSAGGISSVSNQAIVGMAYQGLITSGQPFVPLFDSVVTKTGIGTSSRCSAPDPLPLPGALPRPGPCHPHPGCHFSLPSPPCGCCGWAGDLDSPGTGTLTLGGINEKMYTGELKYTPITQELYYCVDMTSPKPSASGSSACPYTGKTVRSSAPSWAWMGTSDFSLITQPVIDQLKASSAYTARLSTPLGRSFASSTSSGASSCGTIIDSGTSALSLTPAVYTTVIAPVNAALAAHRHRLQRQQVRQEGRPLQLPMHRDRAGRREDAGGVTLTIVPHNYYQPVPGSDYLELLITSGGFDEPNIIGQVMMESYYTVFDRENKRIGFAPIAGCGGEEPINTCAPSPPPASPSPPPSASPA